MPNYDLTHIPALRDLQDLAKRQNAKHKALDSRVKALENNGAQANKIESIKVNGAAQAIGSDKSVNITVPTKVSQLSNDSGYQTGTQVSDTVTKAVAAADHLKRNLQQRSARALRRRQRLWTRARRTVCRCMRSPYLQRDGKRTAAETIG